jgi:spore coat polysaccharide biosynthesis protein SpsF
MSTMALLAVRTGSSRLPAKALMPILGKPMLERMLDRVSRAKRVDQIVIATTHLDEDDPIEELAHGVGASCYRGPVDDVLGRMAGAVTQTGVDRVVELLGDNPLVHSDIIDEVCDFFETGAFDYAVNVTREQPHAPASAARFPIGVRVEVYTPAVIIRCAQEADDPRNREHSTSYIGEHPDRFKLGYFEAKGGWAALNRPNYTFAVNYQQNFDLVERIFSTCYPQDTNFSLHAVMRALRDQPSLTSMMGTPQRMRPTCEGP